VAFAETAMALSAFARWRCDHSPTRGVLRARTQPRASAFGVSRPDAGRDVLRHRGWRAGRPDLTRGCRAPSTRGEQPIGVLRQTPYRTGGRKPDMPPQTRSSCADGQRYRTKEQLVCRTSESFGHC
jgi:hypothetical protein